MNVKNCPSCNTSWEEEQTIYEYFIKKEISKNTTNLKESKIKEEGILLMSRIEANRIAEHYGCTKENPKHFGINVVGIKNKLTGSMDKWKCLQCKNVFISWGSTDSGLISMCVEWTTYCQFCIFVSAAGVSP